AAAAVLGRQDVGAAAAAALGTALVFHPPAARARSVGAFAAGFALVLGSAALAIWWSGFALDLVRETILAPLWGVVHFSYLGRPALWPLWRQDAALRENAFSYFPPVFFDRYWPAISESALYRQTAVIDAALKLVYHLPWIVLLLAALVTLARWRRGAGGAPLPPPPHPPLGTGRRHPLLPRMADRPERPARRGRHRRARPAPRRARGLQPDRVPALPALSAVRGGALRVPR